MALPQRNDPAPHRPGAIPSSAAPASDGSVLGGEVGRMQADLARRLAPVPLAVPTAPGERIVRVASVAGGLVALAAGYAAAAFLLFH